LWLRDQIDKFKTRQIKNKKYGILAENAKFNACQFFRYTVKYIKQSITGETQMVSDKLVD